MGDMIDREQLHQEGYAMLRRAIPAERLADLCVAFDAGVKPSDQWPTPRGSGWRHSLVDLDPHVQAVCRLPELLAVVGELIGERFFLSQVAGREPLEGCGHQKLHRDLCAQRPGDTVIALAYFDDYGPWNGATRIVPGSHRQACGQPESDRRTPPHHSDRLFCGAPLHQASRNGESARRQDGHVGSVRSGKACSQSPRARTVACADSGVPL